MIKWYKSQTTERLILDEKEGDWEWKTQTESSPLLDLDPGQCKGVKLNKLKFENLET